MASEPIVLKPLVYFKYGPVAQLGERCIRIAEVAGSNPVRSTILIIRLKQCRFCGILASSFFISGGMYL